MAIGLTGPETEYVANCSHRHVYSAFLHYRMSIRPIEPVCTQAILPMTVTLFPSGVLSITIPSINGNTLFCSEWNGEHAGETFMLLGLMGFEICSFKIEKNCRICDNFYL